MLCFYEQCSELNEISSFTIHVNVKYPWSCGSNTLLRDPALVCKREINYFIRGGGGGGGGGWS